MLTLYTDLFPHLQNLLVRWDTQASTTKEPTAAAYSGAVLYSYEASALI